jgi:hypothetical protein
MEKRKVGRPRLTDAQKDEKSEKQKEQLKLKLAKIRSTETIAARKERASDLIKIGAIISQYHDVKGLIKYLEKPKYIQMDGAHTIEFIHEKPTLEGVEFCIFIHPKVAPKKRP